jgi:hypothetical protein
MIKIFCNTSQENYLLLGMEFESFKLVDSPWNADLIFSNIFSTTTETDSDQWSIQNLKYDQILIIPVLWHGSENDNTHRKIFKHFLKNCQQGTLLLLCQYQKFAEKETSCDRINILTYDMMFNYTKAYFSQLPFQNHFVNTQPSWYWAGNNCYTINHWSRESQHRSRIFLSASRPWVDRPLSIRHTLQKHLKNYSKSGYLAIYDSDFVDNNSIIGLYSHKEDPLSNGQLQFDVSTGDTFKLSQFTSLGDNTRGFSPLHMNYFEDSFISIYEETVIYGPNIFITEKTFVPLIQGHFVLPFANFGTIENLKEMGFMLPDFIDYSYDTVHDLDKRKNIYMEEVDRLVNQSLSWWIDKRNQNLDILFHNRRFFWNRPYDQFIPTAKNMLQKSSNPTQTNY